MNTTATAFPQFSVNDTVGYTPEMRAVNPYDCQLNKAATVLTATDANGYVTVQWQNMRVEAIPALWLRPVTNGMETTELTFRIREIETGTFHRHAGTRGAIKEAVALWNTRAGSTRYEVAACESPALIFWPYELPNGNRA